MVKIENFQKIRQEAADQNAQLVAISKMKSVEEIRGLYEAGQRDFGENRVQEWRDKHEELPSDIRWHMVGHLQRNKVKYIASKVHLIHSLDSVRLIREVDKRARKENRTISGLLQIHIAREESKYGFQYGEVRELLEEGVLDEFPNVNVCGFMGMATLTDDEEQIRDEFRQLSQFFQEIREDHPRFEWLSMGMTNDYQIALEEGSNMLRIGRLLFGERD